MVDAKMGEATGGTNYFGGIEGGATCSKLVLMNEEGKELCWTEAAGTNFFLEGMDVCHRRIVDLVTEAKRKAGLPQGLRLKGLGMSLSGAEDEHFNQDFVAGLQNSYPDLAENYYLVSDSVGTVVTALGSGGIVVISGTGSSCRLVNPDGKVYCCGGWGHMLGDYGSAYWISIQAIKTVFDTEDGLNKSPYDISYVKDKMMAYYELKSKIGILDHLHKKFDKPKFAQFCKILAKGASDHKDLLCYHLFREAGRILGRHVLAVAKYADKSLVYQTGGLPIVVVGSVWKSFELLKEGFLEGLQPRGRGDPKIDAIKLYRLKASPAIGAAVLVAKEANVALPVDYSTMAEVFYENDI